MIKITVNGHRIIVNFFSIILKNGELYEFNEACSLQLIDFSGVHVPVRGGAGQLRANYSNFSKVSLAARDGLVFLKFQQIGKDCKKKPLRCISRGHIPLGIIVQ